MITNPDQLTVNYNVPQYLNTLVQAQVTYAIWGRAAGKTHGLTAPFVLNNVRTMPRSNGGIAGPSYAKAYTDILPKMLKAWEQFGLIEDKHYWYRKPAPKAYKVPKALLAPLKYDNCISWFNGAVTSLISLDSPTTMNNGADIDYLLNDESKLCDRNKLKEVILTVRGNKTHFGHLSNHLSMLFATDMPTTSNGLWILDSEKQMDKEKIELIIKTSLYLIGVKEKLAKPGYSETYRISLQKEIRKYENYLTQLRKETVYVSYASTLDNVTALGIEPIKNFKRTLSDLEFSTSVLNKKILNSANGFYPLIDEARHSYEMANHGYIDTLNHRAIPERDCRWDADVQAYAPLDIAFDHNNAINSLMVGQRSDYDYRYLNSLYVLKPLFLRDLVKKFCTYYHYHHNKTVIYYYDNTSVGGNAKGDSRFYEEVESTFIALGWNVQRVYLGQATQHYTRYQTWLDIASGKDARMLRLRFNRTNCHAWYVSCKSAGIVQGRDGFKKDKRPENDIKVPAEEATHLSEAGDVLLQGVLGRYQSSQGSSISISVI